LGREAYGPASAEPARSSPTRAPWCA